MESLDSGDGDGEREVILPNGDVYVGNFEGQLLHGAGKYTWSDGAIYEGNWDSCEMTGEGRIRWPSGAAFDGSLCRSFIDGYGTLMHPNGSTYKGFWRMNRKHGSGIAMYLNGDVYEGFWSDGLQEGSGKYEWSDGSVYQGTWKAGKMDGTGEMRWPNGDCFVGSWSDGLFHGKGCYKYADGTCYRGLWSRGAKDGRGIFYCAGSELPTHQQVLKYVGYADGEEATCSRLLKFCRFVKQSGRISNGSMASMNDAGRCIPLDRRAESHQHRESEEVLVYEREYVQGVLVMEKPGDFLGTAEESKSMTWRKHARGPSETIYKGHRSYYLMLNLQLGIRYTVGKITPVPLREVRRSDFGPRARIHMHFPHGGARYTPPHNSASFFWKDYCPMVFRNLRAMFRIDAADYMMSICGGDSLKELSSPGKSGSIFYLSHDERFVIKTLKKNEVKVLLKMLPEYYGHVSNHENTLITKFFGLHRITLKSGRKVRFVVMGNMFCTELRIHRKYDLKGSSQGRSVDRLRIKESSSTLKDLDLSYSFYLEKSWRESLFRQISLDCMFLESQSIIDYSMLLGVHFRAPEHLKTFHDDPNVDPDACSSKGFVLVAHEPGSVSSLPGSHIRGSMVRTSATGDEEFDLLLPGSGRLRVQLGVNMPAQARQNNSKREADMVEQYNVVLYLGIIDILQEYNLTKRLEHAAKAVRFDPATISAVDPRLYHKRFLGFMQKVFLESEGFI